MSGQSLKNKSPMSQSKGPYFEQNVASCTAPLQASGMLFSQTPHDLGHKTITISDNGPLQATDPTHTSAVSSQVEIVVSTEFLIGGADVCDVLVFVEAVEVAVTVLVGMHVLHNTGHPSCTNCAKKIVSPT
jgi:hypothetical protein